MYLRPGIVILKFILSHGVLFLLVSSAIDVATAVGWCPIECSYVQWLQQMGCVEMLYVRWLQQIYSRWNTRTVVASRRACLAKLRARPEFAVYSALI
jgi:hypothetical protein